MLGQCSIIELHLLTCYHNLFLFYDCVCVCVGVLAVCLYTM